MKLSRRAIIIIALIVLIVIPLIIGIFVYISRNSGSPESYIEREAIVFTRDKDTGEIIEDDQNLNPEKNEAPSILVLGMEELIRRGILSSQVHIIRDQLGGFANQRLDGKYESITLRPQDIVFNDGVVRSTIRLGQTDNFLPVTITAKNTGETNVIVYDPENEFGGNYTGETVTLHAD